MTLTDALLKRAAELGADLAEDKATRTTDHTQWLADLAADAIRTCGCGVQVDTDADPAAIDDDNPDLITCEMCRANCAYDDVDWSYDR